MIEVYETVEYGYCANCAFEIVHLIGDLGTDKWTHRHTLKHPCKDAPLAQPDPSRPTWTE